MVFQKGELNYNRINGSWNKGLTKETDERILNYSKEAAISRIGRVVPLFVRKKISKKVQFLHKTQLNYGMKGKKHKKSTIEKIKKQKGWKMPRVIVNDLAKKRKKNAKINPNYGMKNKHHNIKTKEKISISKIEQYKKCPETIQKIKEARKLQIFPKKDTLIEVKIQSFLSLLHIEFITHKYMSEITHSYQCDILIPKQRLIEQKTIIEVDGCYWHGCKVCAKRDLTNNQRSKKYKDNIRTKELKEKGYRVIRLWGHQIEYMKLNDFKEKLNEIDR